MKEKKISTSPSKKGNKQKPKKFSSLEFLKKLKGGVTDKYQFWRDINEFYTENEVQDVVLFVNCFSIINELFKTDYASGQFLHLA